MTNSNATWTKLRSGEWGARVIGRQPQRGDVLTVEKRNGETTAVVVQAIVWSGEDRDTGEPLAVCAVLSPSRPVRRKASRGASTPAPQATSTSTPAATPTGRATGFRGPRKPQPAPAPAGYIDVVGESLDDATPTFVF